MDDYIRREAAKAQIRKAYTRIEDRVAINCVLNDVPAADVVEVRHAYWRDIQPPDQDNNVQCWCSACGAGELHADGMIVPYCWKCGAKMDGGAEDGGVYQA